MLSKMIRFFESHIETSDRHVDERYRTHYYKTTKDKMIKAVEEMIAKDPTYSLIEVSKDRGEVAANIVKSKKGLLILTIISAGPYKTSVDIAFSVDRGFIGGSGARLVKGLYDKLNRQFTTVTL